MATMFPERCPAAKDGAPVAAAERLLFERLSRELDDAWSVIHDCGIRAHGEARTVAFVLLHPRFGIALLGRGEGEPAGEGAPAVAVLRAMLGELGFTRRFAGHLTIVGASLGPPGEGGLRQRLAVAFAAAPANAVEDPAWAEWLVRRLAPQGATAVAAAVAAAPVRRADAPRREAVPLGAPQREDAWRVAEAPRVRPAAGGAAARLTAEPLLASREAAARPASWIGMALAAVVVAAVLVGMALLSHGNG